MTLRFRHDLGGTGPLPEWRDPQGWRTGANNGEIELDCGGAVRAMQQQLITAENRKSVEQKHQAVLLNAIDGD